MKTKKDIEYRTLGLGSRSVVIPAGTRIREAENTFENRTADVHYWTYKWLGMTKREEEWWENNGFGLSRSEINN